MSIAIATLESISPYSQSRFHNVPREDKETADDHERRTWRERLHVNKDGFVFIPPMSFKNMLSEAAKYLSMQVPGKGKSTYTKHFEAGILCMDPVVLPFRKADIQEQWLHVPSDGQRGGTKRVLKCFPVIPEWIGDVTFHVLDPAISKDVFRKHLEEGGKFIGIGRFRPRNNGFYGRFQVKDVVWES
jgi:hypothetical protein